jgi:phosphatidylserine synthase
VIASLVHAFRKDGPLGVGGPLLNTEWSVAWLVLAVALAALMTSKIRFYSFKDLPWGKKQPGFLILLLAIIGAVIWNFSEWALLILACSYTITAVTLHIVRFTRQRTSSRTVAP